MDDRRRAPALIVPMLMALALSPAPARADGLAVEALVNVSALTSKPADQPHTSYADQPGSAVGGMLRLSGGIAGDYRWIAGGLAEQVQLGAMFATAAAHGTRYGGQLGLGWMALASLRLELVAEIGSRSNGSDWFSYWGIRPALTWTVRSRSGLGFSASLGLAWRKESQDDAGPMAPASGREVGASLAIGLAYE